VTDPKAQLHLQQSAPAGEDGQVVLRAEGSIRTYAFDYDAHIRSEITNHGAGGLLQLYDEYTPAEVVRVKLDAAPKQNSYINNGGNLGIGTTNPQTQLQIGDFASQARLLLAGSNEESAAATIYFGDNDAGNDPINYGMGIRYDSKANSLRIIGDMGAKNPTEGNEPTLMTIVRDTGNAGIGSSEPAEKLHVAGNLLVEGAIIGNVEPPKKFTAGHAYEVGEDLTGKAGSALIMDSGKVFLSTTPTDKRVIGFLEKIFSGVSSLDSTEHDDLASVIGLGDSRHWKKVIVSDACGNRLSVNYTPTIEGAKVCNENGDIRIGDFLTTSSRPGYFMKQTDDLVHNYTAARCMEDITFDDSGVKSGVTVS